VCFHRLTRNQPASGLRRQAELCQQAASGDLTAQNGVVVLRDWLGADAGVLV